MSSLSGAGAIGSKGGGLIERQPERTGDAPGLAFARSREPGLEMLLHEPIEHRALGATATVRACLRGAGRGVEAGGDGRFGVVAVAGHTNDRTAEAAGRRVASVS